MCLYFEVPCECYRSGANLKKSWYYYLILFYCTICFVNTLLCMIFQCTGCSIKRKKEEVVLEGVTLTLSLDNQCHHFMSCELPTHRHQRTPVFLMCLSLRGAAGLLCPSGRRFCSSSSSLQLSWTTPHCRERDRRCHPQVRPPHLRKTLGSCAVWELKFSAHCFTISLYSQVPSWLISASAKRSICFAKGMEDQLVG